MAELLPSDLVDASDTVVVIQGVHYYPRQLPPPKHRGQERSSVWALGYAYSTSPASDAVIDTWRCCACQDLVKLYNGQISNAKQHMRRKHRARWLAVNEEEGSSQEGGSILPS